MKTLSKSVRFSFVSLATVGTVGLMLVLAVPAFADFIPLPVKWSQLPDMDIGMDHLSIHIEPVVADDYISQTLDPIVAVRWWGSYIGYNGQPPSDYVFVPGFAVPFHLGFYTDVPAGPTEPFSHPGTLVYDTVVFAQEEFFGTSGDPESVFMYNAYLPEAFDQAQYHPAEGPAVLWLRIDRYDREDWGWHESVTHNIDDAVTGPHLGPWAPLFKKDGSSADMAFELMIIPEPTTMLLVAFGSIGLLMLWRRR